MRRLGAAVATAVVVAAAVAGCGGGGSRKAVSTVPKEVPRALVPATLVDGAFSVAEDTKAHEAFAFAGERALIGDGRLWTVRKGERLVATLQVTTLKAKVDTSLAADRDKVTRSVLPGSKERLSVGGTDVISTSTADKTVYVWFATSILEVLQIKSTAVNPEVLLADLLAFQVMSPDWKPIPLPPS
jgi:hypothetical protein